jgi:hypothetical protein
VCPGWRKCISLHMFWSTRFNVLLRNFITLSVKRIYVLLIFSDYAQKSTIFTEIIGFNPIDSGMHQYQPSPFGAVASNNWEFLELPCCEAGFIIQCIVLCFAKNSRNCTHCGSGNSFKVNSHLRKTSKSLLLMSNIMLKFSPFVHLARKSGHL